MPKPKLNLEHVLGYSLYANNISFIDDCVLDGTPALAYSCGSIICISTIKNHSEDPSNYASHQLVLRGSDAAVTALDTVTIEKFEEGGFSRLAGTGIGSLNGGRPQVLLASGHTSSSDANGPFCYLNVWSLQREVLLAGNTLQQNVFNPPTVFDHSDYNYRGENVLMKQASVGAAARTVTKGATEEPVMMIMSIRTPHRTSINAVRFSRDGKFLATVGTSMAPSGKVVTGSQVSLAHGRSLAELCIFDSSTGSLIATLSENTVLVDESPDVVWSRRNFNCASTENKNALSRNHSYILYVPFFSSVRVCTLRYNVAGLKWELLTASMVLPGLSISLAQGKSASLDESISLMGGLARRYTSAAALITPASETELLLCGTYGGELVVFDAEHIKWVGTLPIGSPVTQLVSSPADCCLFVGCANGRMCRVDYCPEQKGKGPTGFVIRSEIQLNGAPVGMAISAEIKYANNKPLYGTAARNEMVVGKRSHPLLALTTTSGRLYTVLTEQMISAVLFESALCGITAVAVDSSLTREFATASGDGAVRVWSLDTYAVLSIFSSCDVCDNVQRVLSSRGSIITKAPKAAGAANSVAASLSTTGEITIPTALAIAHTEGNNSMLIISGWSDGYVRVLQMPMCAESSRFHADGTDTTPVIGTCLVSFLAHKGPVTSVDVCEEYILTANNGQGATSHQHNRNFSTTSTDSLIGGDRTARVWANTLAQPGTTPILITEISPVSLAFIDNTTPRLVHTVSCPEVQHNIYDLDKVLANKQVFLLRKSKGVRTSGAPSSTAEALTCATILPARKVKTHAIRRGSLLSARGELVCATQNLTSEHEAIVGTTDGRVIFLDADSTSPNQISGAISDHSASSVVCSLAVVHPAEQSADTSANNTEISRLATGIADGGIVIYDLTCDKLSRCRSTRQTTITPVTHSFSHTSPVTALVWMREGQKLLSATNSCIPRGCRDAGTPFSNGELIVWNYSCR